MTHEAFFDRISKILRPLGSAVDEGEDYPVPPLEVLRYQVRTVRLHWFPVLGRALSVVAIVRQPDDLPTDKGGTRRLLDRIARAAHGRFPPWPGGGPGLVVGLTSVILSNGPLGTTDEETLGITMRRDQRSRVVHLGVIRVNLQQEAMAIAIGPTPRDLFPEPIALAEGLSGAFGRFVPPLDFE